MTGEDDLTVATYEELLKDFPKKNDLYFTLVDLYLKQNRYDKALEALDQIEAVFGKSENVTATKYDILLRQNKPLEALKTLEDYNKEFSSPYVLTKLGDHSMAEYKDTAALAYYRRPLTFRTATCRRCWANRRFTEPRELSGILPDTERFRGR